MIENGSKDKHGWKGHGKTCSIKWEGRGALNKLTTRNPLSSHLTKLGDRQLSELRHDKKTMSSLLGERG